MKIFLLTVALLGGIIILLGSIHQHGVKAGKAEVTYEWNQEKARTAEHIRDLKAEYVLLQRDHKQRMDELRDEVRETKAEYETELVIARNTYAQRLLNSEQRADLYKRQAESGTIEHRNLADYATELDRSLEEGRHLVRELRTTLGQREREIGILSRQINADRSTLNKAGSVNGN